MSVKNRETISPPHSAFIQKVPEASDMKPKTIPNSVELFARLSAYSEPLYKKAILPPTTIKNARYVIKPEGTCK